MKNVKTTISISDSLFEKLENLADELNLSYDELIAIALGEFIEREECKRLLAQLNAVYEDDPQVEELWTSQAYRSYQRKSVEVD